MPPISRPQLLLYAALALGVLVLGGRALLADRVAAPPPDAVVEAGGGTPGPGSTAGEAAGAGGSEAPGNGLLASDGSQPGTGGPGAAPAGAAVARPTQAELAVHVAGAVTSPGVYRVPDGARVQDAIELAGGARRGADLHALNLAAKVSDGQQILVPRRGRRTAGAATGTAAPGGAVTGGARAAAATPDASGAGDGAPDAVLDLNTASIEDLETLDGVGPAIAQKIVVWREANGGFRTVDDLAQVSGIGPKKLEAIRPRVAV